MAMMKLNVQKIQVFSASGTAVTEEKIIVNEASVKWWIKSFEHHNPHEMTLFTDRI